MVKMTKNNGLLAVVFEASAMTAVQYDQVIRDLERAGVGAPDGRIYHLAAPKGEGWYVLDVWETAEKFNAFAATLVPILQRNGVTPPQPQILPAYNVIG
jgi:hypothetical protein